MSKVSEKMKEEIAEPQGIGTSIVNASCVDFSFQFNTAKEYEKVEKKIFTYICEIAKDCGENSIKKGIIAVVGWFDSSKDYLIPGMRQIGKNPVQKYLSYSISSHKKELVSMMSENLDGAFVINRNGQLLGSGIYLTVDNPSFEIPDGSGTRHITAASFSAREDVQSIITLSEETNTVRVWKNGTFVEQYEPFDDEGQDGEEPVKKLDK
jgi:DNA integrity scanning protein DisA with diadenylate cyclase activity